MERIVKGRSSTLSNTFTFTPTGTPSVALTRMSDGTAVTTGSVSGAGATWSYTIPATSNTQLDTYHETWTATTGGSAQTFTDDIEVAGGSIFTLAEARAVAPLSSTTNYPDTAIFAMRTLVEQALEDACGVAFVPRYKLETFNGDGTTVLSPTWTRVTAIRSATITSTALTVGQLATVVPYGLSAIYYPSGWTAGFGNVTVGYEHGHPYPPERVKRAALRLAKRWLVEGPVDDRATSFSNDDGTYSLVTPGQRGVLFDLPEVNAVVQQYGLNVGIA